MARPAVDRAVELHRTINARELDAFVDCLADDVLWEDMARGLTFRGRSGVLSALAEWLRAFPDLRIVEASYVAADGAAVGTYVRTGTSKGPFLRFRGNGRRIVVSTCDIVRLDAAGQVVLVQSYYDLATVLVQLGHLAPFPEPQHNDEVDRTRPRAEAK